jgi:hypothetical protein
MKATNPGQLLWSHFLVKLEQLAYQNQMGGAADG